ncbi:hypothetical protein BATDEDRAFT_35821 [Batrachochytrium dendrobatidis JAM81]|uniref:Kynurenine 3-monooxygenase n=2 Tax=Batrachochytrium dendrobatidis TaxID=109871 RepID=F4P9F4_BATDJ|nr:kynurenine 3-monooxygenase [Batrachochytrium dendrobatidis JAM81]EGF78217.1 hypothetical protein BATDEDRAFT_35821 [Batrachochytrium dendrobatidis JAM81]KAK5664555.1 kynurenine 3-monooxygenase, mitochondrial precursor [Batrachochytrium dendrobatidis]OAJ44574.1 hypothetical protein BDEG_27788 [Batrachochytrium dendrobatidis JEL423]|eukprot:XP_006681171.1 hypothetical protein BATDEDRAFT_35821 [Batrachochytrium dendrobatidis JAM81]
MTEFSVAIIGGGLVGSLSAVYFAKRGYTVTVYEKQSDIRQSQKVSGRSINLALSARGIAALQSAGVYKSIAETLIPMQGRMLHDSNGTLSSQQYGIHGEFINSVDRRFVNEELLNAAEKYSNVKIYFEHSVVSCDFNNRTMIISDSTGQNITVHANLIVGADGAYSRVRTELLKKTIGFYSQEYIDHGYVELTMPATHSGNYAMDPGHLHIWPRQTFMMIALPNVDRSFTVTLFMPWFKFEEIQTPTQLIEFFEDKFADAVPLIGKGFLVQEYFKNTKGSLVSIKCKPYHYKDRAVIIGDAAHAMVPFYGQGMNCGFEDVLILDNLFSKHLDTLSISIDSHDDRKVPQLEMFTLSSISNMYVMSAPTPSQLASILKEYSTIRNPDAEAICDLALNNYIEMRSSVTTWSYLLRKKFESAMYALFPNLITPLYTMVSFSRIPYSEAMRKWKAQTWWYRTVGRASIWCGVLGVGVYALLRTPHVRKAIVSVLDY